MIYDVIVIGGGPAGMAAALAADKEGAKVLIIERDARLGGILNQCIHNGFGLHYFGEELTGPEYAARFKTMVDESDIEVWTDTMVVSVTKDRRVSAVSPDRGVIDLQAGAIVLAMGCRERTAGAICLTGFRPAGIYTAGMAQRLCNINGYLVGKKVVILGSGDIGLIMARRMTYEGARVVRVLELMPYSTGLKRNIVQCLDDYGIPLSYSHTVTRVVGKRHLEGLYVAPVDAALRPIKEREEFIECDTLLLSVGLIPENDLVQDMGMDINPIVSGAVVDENRQTTVKGIFSCGNVLHVHDLVDNVSREGDIAGRAAGKFAGGKLSEVCDVPVKASGGVRYVIPNFVGKGAGTVKIYFRVANIYKNVRLNVTSGEQIILTKKYNVLSPGEMECIEINKFDVDGAVTVALEGVE